MPYTEVEPGIVVCDDCGAYADKEENVVHHKTCKPGECEKWCKFYDEQPKS